MKTNQATTAKTAAMNDIEWDVIEGNNSDFAIQYPRMQWVHGSKQAAGFNKTGGLFIAKEEYPNFTGEGFTPTTFVTRDGSEIEGYAATEANIAVIRVKHQWVKDDSGKNVPLAHVLCVIKGCDDTLSISLKGPSKALEFQKAFNQHIAQIVSVANRTKPQGTPSLEPFALWFKLRAGTLGPAPSKDGKSTSIVTPLELATPDVINRDYAVSLWVGSDNYRNFAGIWKDTETWQKQPIWNQHADEVVDETPGFTGDGDGPATDQQLQFLINLCMAKGYEEKEIMLGISNGGMTQFDQLTRAEASQIIETLKAK